MSPGRDPLQTLLDERAIQDVLHRYCRGVDRLDEALLCSAYHEDSYDDHGLFKGTGHDFARFCVKALRTHCDATMHSLTNVMITFDDDDPDLARCESYVVARHWRDRDGEQTLETAGGRYVDRLERRDGAWAIAHRVVVLDWGKIEKVDQAFPLEGYSRGERSERDRSYRRD